MMAHSLGKKRGTHHEAKRLNKVVELATLADRFADRIEDASVESLELGLALLGRKPMHWLKHSRRSPSKKWGVAVAFGARGKQWEIPKPLANWAEVGSLDGAQ